MKERHDGPPASLELEPVAGAELCRGQLRTAYYRVDGRWIPLGVFCPRCLALWAMPP
jgi:hypothetical protein